MIKIVSLFSFLFFLTLGVSHAWALPDCVGSWSITNWTNCIGTYTWENGDKYQGVSKDGKRHGQGTYIYADGSKYVGEWENNKRHGYAIQYNADGSIRREGIFKDDEFLYAETREKKEPSKLDKYKSTCEEIGFTPGTEKFGDCVMKLMDKD